MPVTLQTLADPPHGAGSTGNGFSTGTNGLNNNLQQCRDNDQLLEDRIEAIVGDLLGEGVIDDTFTSPILSAGTGLSANYAAFSALIGFVVTKASGSIGGLTPSTDNYIWLRQDGTFTVNTTGTDPGTSGNGATLIGKVTCDGSGVTAVDETNQQHSGLSYNSSTRIVSIRRLSVAKQVNPNGGGLKHGRASTGSVSASTTVDVTLAWTTSFADTSYSAVASIVDASNYLQIVGIKTKAAGSVVVTVTNSDGGGAHTGEVQVVGFHD